MNLPVLKIADLKPVYPIIQGGMAIRISTGKLAGTVAKCGGIGLIAASGMSSEELLEEMDVARKIAGPDGIVGINIMVAASNFELITEVAMENKIDLVVAGAGFSRRLFSLGKKYNVPVVPIVSSKKAAIVSQKSGAAAIVVEGFEAGGHLGTEVSTLELIPEIVKSVNIPVIGAGGVGDQEDFLKILRYGVSGVQIATMFALTKESNAHENWKNHILNANEKDMVIIDSPVGFPGRSINNKFLEKFKNNPIELATKKCIGCLKHCSKKFCLIQALENARLGNIDEGLVFSGKYFYKIKKILSVKEVFDILLKDIEKL
ncbi:MAG: nitronate monooxygenase [Candidatus Muirbacterium halophilum]|nr:nitronate monooxygenase [Candidatus Muirbacterium halophilum]MCK9477030.1 nitronate monooxygenase [Candidatus Muirbacterium halophilum]